MMYRTNQGQKCWTTEAFPIFNVDPYCTGTDSTIEHNIETGGGKGELHLDTRIGVTIPSENRQKINVSAVNR